MTEVMDVIKSKTGLLVTILCVSLFILFYNKSMLIRDTQFINVISSSSEDTTHKPAVDLREQAMSPRNSFPPWSLMLTPVDDPGPEGMLDVSLANIWVYSIAPEMPSTLQGAHQDDENLVKHIREEWILNNTGDFISDLKDPISYSSQYEQDRFVDDLLGEKESGFFVECGAATGTGLSNTLFLEQTRKWTGILIEANPVLFKKLLVSHRKAYLLNACLSPSTEAQRLNFTTASLLGGLSGHMQESHIAFIEQNNKKIEYQEIQCFPLMAILKALNVKTVDYFSLDIEGAEVEILDTIQFDNVHIDVLTVEFRIVADRNGTTEKLGAIRKIMVDRYGYKEVSILHNTDVVFQKHN